MLAVSTSPDQVSLRTSQVDAERPGSASDVDRMTNTSPSVTSSGVAPVLRPTSTAPWPDLDAPNVARMYDCLLGGCLNFHSDRTAVRRLLDDVPQAATAARATRGFLAAAVRHLAATGIRQFIDVGTGLPMTPTVGEIAAAAGRPARVVYVDIDPVVVMHHRARMAARGDSIAVLADVREPDQILGDPRVRSLLDLTAPTAVLLGGVLQFLADADDPAGVVGRIRSHLAPGSHLVISHVFDDGCGLAPAATAAFAATGMPLTVRGRSRVRSLFDGLDLLAPGIVPAGRWRAEEDSDPLHALRLPVLVGVARVGPPGW
jgi:hypothetical protein